MNIKKLIRTKSFWTGIASIATGMSMVFNDRAEVGIQTIIMGLAVIFARDALAKNGKDM